MRSDMSLFQKPAEKIRLIKIRRRQQQQQQQHRVLYMKTFSYLWQYLAEFFSEREMFEIKVYRKPNTHFIGGNIFPKTVSFRR
jgi:hypothetical protein